VRGSQRVGDHDAMGLTPIPETVIEERAFWILAVNRNQDLLGKTILVLRRTCHAVVEIDAHEWRELRHEVQRLAPALDQLFQPDRLNYAFLMNRDAQVHLHVIPRYASPRRWHGKSFVDDHWGESFGNEQQPMQPAELGLLADEFRALLATGTVS
jgi:diadenosine tetraphosphate (Ap4A) HIT family hydrolase